MCNPIANKIMERSKVKEVSSQQNQLLQGQRIDQGGAEGDNDNLDSISNNEESPSTDLSLMAVATIATASDGSPTGSTVGPGEKTAKKNSKEQAVDKIREYDVLMGRGSGPNRHSGNIHFRAIVGEVFDEFLSKHGSDRTMIGDSGSDMLRIDPSTKNRLAQAVLDKITIEKNGRFLQKLNKKELSEAIKKDEHRHLIKARAFSLMDAAMANTVTAESVAAEGDDRDESPALEKCAGFNPNAVVYYRIIPEKQILAKIKQTFRFLRDQNEASNAETHRQRARRVAAASMGGVSRDQISAAALGVVGGMQLSGGLAGGLANSNSMAYALMQRMGLDALNMNPSPLPDQLNYANTRGLNNIIAPTPSITMSAIKNLHQSNPSVGAMDLASRLLVDLPHPNRIISTSEPASAPSFLQGSALAAAVSQLDGSNNGGKVIPSMENSSKRFLEELTLSRLANLRRQREDTISAFLSMERSTSGGAPASAGIGNAASQINCAALSASALPAQQLQRLLSLNSASQAQLSMATAPNQAVSGSLPSSTSEPLSLLLQLNNGSNGIMNGNTLGRSPGNNSLRAFNSSSF